MGRTSPATRRWRPRLALGLALMGVAGLVALDVGPRQVIDRQVDACGLEGLDVGLAPAPVAWQLATGGLGGEVRVPTDTVTDVVVDRMREGPLVAPQVTFADDAVRVDALVEAPMGRVPVEVYLVPEKGRGVACNAHGSRIGQPRPDPRPGRALDMRLVVPGGDSESRVRPAHPPAQRPYLRSERRVHEPVAKVAVTELVATLFVTLVAGVLRVVAGR